MYQRVFEDEISGKNSLRTNQGVLKDDKALSEEDTQGSSNLGMERASPHHRLCPQKCQMFLRVTGARRTLLPQEFIPKVKWEGFRIANLFPDNNSRNLS